MDICEVGTALGRGLERRDCFLRLSRFEQVLAELGLNVRVIRIEL
jgi:hypothetical protein